MLCVSQGTCVCISVVFMPHSGAGHKAYICETPVTSTDVFSKEGRSLISMHENSSSAQPSNTWHFLPPFFFSFIPLGGFAGLFLDSLSTRVPRPHHIIPINKALRPLPVRSHPCSDAPGLFSGVHISTYMVQSICQPLKSQQT